MMKIKVKKEMRLDELIKWARSNPELSQGQKFFYNRQRRWHRSFSKGHK